MAGQLENAQIYAYYIIGNLNAGVTAFIDWNLVLNKQGGPKNVNNYCDAPIMCDTENDIVQEKLSFTYIGHFRCYIEPGAKRIASTKYMDALQTVSMKNPDGSIITVFLNRLNEEVPVALRIDGQVAEFSIPANAMITGIIEK